MSNHRNKFTQLAKRVSRIEGKCNRIIAEVKQLRESLHPRHDELDGIIVRLHNTARQMRDQSIRERKHISRMDSQL